VWLLAHRSVRAQQANIGVAVFSFVARVSRTANIVMVTEFGRTVKEIFL
jgi:hypothetical protein